MKTHRRQRLTWSKEGAQRERQADPYTQNVDRQYKSPDRYMGPDAGPSAWAEDPHMRHRWKEEGRGEANWPEMRPDTFGGGQPVAPAEEPEAEELMEDAEAAVEASVKTAEQQRKIEAQLEDKAAKCIKVAELMFPDAARGTIKAQAVDLMDMTENSLLSTLRRQKLNEKTLQVEAAQDEEEMKASDEEEKEAVEEDEKEASKCSCACGATDVAPQEVQASDEEDEKDAAEKEEEKDAAEEDEKEASVEEDEKDAAEEDEEKDAAEEDEKEASVEEPVAEEASLVDMILSGTETDDVVAASDSDEIEMEASIMDTSELADDDTSLLDRLFDDMDSGVAEITAQAKSKTSSVPPKKGVKTLRQVVASGDSKSEATALQGLWKSDPNVDGIFS